MAGSATIPSGGEHAEMPESPLEVLVVLVRDGAGATVHLVGELDVSSVDQLRDVLEGLLVTTHQVDLDLAELTFVDSTGIGALLALHRRLADLGGTLVLRRPRAQIHRVLQMTQLDRILTVVER